MNQPFKNLLLTVYISQYIDGKGKMAAVLVWAGNSNICVIFKKKNCSRTDYLLNTHGYKYGIIIK